MGAVGGRELGRGKGWVAAGGRGPRAEQLGRRSRGRGDPSTVLALSKKPCQDISVLTCFVNLAATFFSSDSGVRRLAS